MADASSAPIGHDSQATPGSSMHGVTGKESVYGYLSKEKDYGQGQFDLPVDSEHKATTMKLFSLAQPHMRSFHLAWFSFFIAFCSTFAAPPLTPIIRENLNLTKADVGNGAIASVVGAIVSRIIIGSLCDLVGPRYAGAFLLMTTVPCTLSMATVSNSTGFIVSRLFIGFVLATFVTCQYWMSSMFNTKIVGLANGLAAGWGNLGGGFIQLVMPYLELFIQESLHVHQFTSWRYCFLISGITQFTAGLLILVYGQDAPDGQYGDLNKSGERKSDNVYKVMLTAITNYRTWIMVILYGYCFGVELTVDNTIHNYFVDRFGTSSTTAGIIASSFGLANIFSRPSGGILSDLAASSYGMRGRLWNLWILQTLGGLFCFVLGLMKTQTTSIVVLVVFSYFVQASCGAVFGIVPFISKRSLGVVSGLTGAGGNAGAALTQAVFFTSASYPTEDGYKYMGIMIMAVTMLVWPLYFPMWGGMACPPMKNSHTNTEEHYYTSEYNAAEKEENLHLQAIKFAENARSERGPVGALEAEAESMAKQKGNDV